jgi:uncharacterized paraquat-inducible protein A
VGIIVMILWWLFMGLSSAYLAYLVLASPWIVPAIAREWRESRRRKAGCCIHCGYDLRASKQSATCPECGALVRESVGDEKKAPPAPRKT